MSDFDLITIGAGSGGVAASRYAATAYSARVAICEMDRVGGTCVIRGCIPKKLYMYAAQFSEHFADARGFGWDLGEPAFDLTRLKASKDAEIDRLERIYGEMLSKANVTLLRGQARLDAPDAISIDGRRYTAKRILIATGGTPQRPPIAGIETALTSNELLQIDTLPAHLVVLGSGYVAVEFASIFRAMGSRVTLAFRSDQPLRGFDRDLRSRFAEAVAARGIGLAPGFVPVRIERHGKSSTVEAEDGRRLVGDVVLNAMGRVPNIAGLNLASAGVTTGPRGNVVVDAYSRTNVPNIHAIGDVTDRVALTPIAIAEGRAFVDTEFGNTPRAIDRALIASAVFALPPIAGIGRTEDDLAKSKQDYRVFEAGFRPMKNTVSGRHERTYMKLLVDAQTDRVLGAHMLGPDAPEIIQSLAVAITMGATKRDFDRTIAMHPTTAEEFVLLRTPRA